MRRLVVALILAGSLAGCSSDVVSGDVSGEICERNWEANRATAESKYMTKERYIDNCRQTNKDIQNGNFP